MDELNARISCSDDTREDLRELTREGERYEGTLRRLIEQHTETIAET